MWNDSKRFDMEEVKEGGASKQRLRSEVPPEQTWDMTTVFPSLESWEEAFADLSARQGLLNHYKGRLAESADILYEVVSKREELVVSIYRAATYAFHRGDEDTSNPVFMAMKGRLGALIAAFMGENAWFEPEVIEIPAETLERFMEEKPELAAYRHFFDKILREKKYMLSPAEEALLRFSKRPARSSVFCRMLTWRLTRSLMRKARPFPCHTHISASISKAGTRASGATPL